MKKEIYTKSELLTLVIDLLYAKYPGLLPYLKIMREKVSGLEVRDLPDEKTAEMMFDGENYFIIINQNFIREYDLNEEDILWLVCHELSHLTLGHLHSHILIKHSKEFCNIAFDCQVNSLLFNLNGRKPIDLLFKTNGINYDQFLKGEDPYGFYFLLFPPHVTRERMLSDFLAAGLEQKQAELLSEFWCKNYDSEPMGLDEICWYLEHFLPDATPESSEEENLFGFQPEDELLSEKQTTWRGEKPGSWFSSPAADSLICRDFESTVMRQKNRRLLRNAIKNAMFPKDSGTLEGQPGSQGQTILPVVSRREAFFIGYGVMPALYNAENTPDRDQEAAVFIDFSFSTSPFHSGICELLSSLTSVFKGPYFAFTTSVSPVTLREIKEKTIFSGGTDLTPVIESINKSRFKKALIITDGEFSPPELKTRAELYVLLFEKKNSFEAIKNAGKVMKVWHLET